MAADRFKPLLDREFLKAELHYEFLDYQESGQDPDLLARLEGWAKREIKRETQAESSFIQRFFVETWGYRDDGVGDETYNLHPKFPIAGAGQTGNRGEADLAVGMFGKDRPSIPQIVCEFKDVSSGLDAPQNRKGNNRSPVYQARDYLWGARRGLFGNEPVQPRYAIVTDMDEFRLYWWDAFPDRYLRFKINNGDLFNPTTLIGNDAEALFDRFLFWRMFRADMLLSDAGRTRLERLIAKQGNAERKLEDDFYQDYRNYRAVLINHILLQRPEGKTRGWAVRLAQKLLDRFIFIMFAEDMGGRVGFPANALSEQLKRQSEDMLLDGHGDEVWTRLKRIFKIMNEGGDMGAAKIHRFNGGLFAPDPDIEALALPNHIFCHRGQGKTQGNIEEHKQTLFYLAATYNFAAEGDAKNSIGLYTLGHIFEQSIVELEKLEADAEDRVSLTDVTKRKRDGVYYTPEWAVRRIIEETIDPLFARWKAEAGWPETGEPSREAAGAYWQRLQAIRIVDPACGSGAFLILALQHLRREFEMASRLAAETKAIDRAIEADRLTEIILANNLYGVDINSASVEITKLSLWLHTAMPNKPLSGLDHSIQCGNSLIDERFYGSRSLYDAEEKDRINTFNWEAAFPEVFEQGGFDAVIGNPPYVKLQNFKKVNADMAAWLSSGSSGEAPYLSATTGNFDLYLPFFEKGLALLNPGGRMGYIAPNLWPTLEYGEGLRGLVHTGRHLEKWLDFRSYQVFEEATVYTAIQIFSKSPNDAIRLAFAGDGDISKVDWEAEGASLPYDEIKSPLLPWLIAPEAVRNIVGRLGREALRLDRTENTKSIFQGIITSADHIYHLKRAGKNTYIHTPKAGGKKAAPISVEIEDALMKPLVSGAEAKRFLAPETETYLLFPYALGDGKASLIPADKMASDYPKAWAYLQSYEEELRAREGGKFDDNGWYRMGRTQNLDKQELPKLLVAQLVPGLRLAFDDGGKFYANNVRVNGILPKGENGWFLLGVLNAPVSNFVFKWLGKPKDNGYFEANKQFIAPLPIPQKTGPDREALEALARQMQEGYSARVETRADLDARLARTARAKQPLEWLLPDVRSIAALEAETPKSVKPADRKKWIDEQRASDEEAALARVTGVIRLDSSFDAVVTRGELQFRVDSVAVAKAFVAPSEEALLLAQWQCVALTFEAGGKDDGKKLIERLRMVARTADPAIAEQIIALSATLGEQTTALQDCERELHELTCRLFDLTPEERALVERGR